VCHWSRLIFSFPVVIENGSVAAKIEVTVASILAAGNLSNLEDIEYTPLIFDITGHFVRNIEFWVRKSVGPL